MSSPPLVEPSPPLTLLARFSSQHIAMIFEVVGRESEVGYRDCPDTYMRYKAKSIRAFVEYGAQSNVKPEYITLCKNALENM